MPLPFKRMYVDLPTDVHEQFQEFCKEKGRPMKTVLAELIERECSPQPSDRSSQRGNKRTK